MRKEIFPADHPNKCPACGRFMKWIGTDIEFDEDGEEHTIPVYDCEGCSGPW